MPHSTGQEQKHEKYTAEIANKEKPMAAAAVSGRNSTQKQKQRNINGSIVSVSNWKQFALLHHADLMPHSTGAAVRCEETSRGGQDRQRETKHQMRGRDQGKGQGHRAKVERTGDNNKKQEKQTIGAASKNKEARWARGEGSKRTADRIQVTSGQRSKRYRRMRNMRQVAEPDQTEAG